MKPAAGSGRPAAKGLCGWASCQGTMSSKARGVGDGDLEGKPVEFAMPNRLVQLALEADRVISY